MGLLSGRGTLDPRSFRHMTPVIEGDMVAKIRISIPHDGTSEDVWDEVTQRWVTPFANTVWEGMARVAPNKDWRARNREWALETTAEHAVRVQINLRKNHLVPKDEWPAPLVDINHGYLVNILDNPDDPILERYLLSVRTAIGASDAWHRTLLCDANLGGRVDNG